MISIKWIIAAAISMCATITSAQNCWHIINVQTGQYLQPSNSPNIDDLRYVWLSHNRTGASYWSMIPLEHGNFHIVNRKSGLYLGMLPNESFAVLKTLGNHSKSGKSQLTKNYQFRLHDKPGEIVSTARRTSLFAAVGGGGLDGKVKAMERCGLPQCQWRFEGHTCD